MAREFFDFDPLTGIAEYVHWHLDGSFSITSEQDVEPVLDFCKELANSGVSDGNFKKEGWLYAALPMVAILDMKKKGFDAIGEHGREATSYLLKEINANYAYFKTTHKHHALR